MVCPEKGAERPFFKALSPFGRIWPYSGKQVLEKGRGRRLKLNFNRVS
jgi:hypothetical protein